MKVLLAIFFGFMGFFSVQSFANFSDSKDHRYASAIESLAQYGVVQGYPDGSYRPDQSVARAEMLKIILLSANIEIMTGQESCFRDIKEGTWFYDIVCFAKAMGIVQGYPDGSFKPNQKVLFSEALKIAIEGFRIETRAIDSPFRYAKYLDFVHQNGIFSQYEYFPEQDMTRGMMAHLAASLLRGQSSSRDYQREVRSSGCGKSQLSSPSHTLLVNGIERHFLTKVGKAYSSSTPAKLILAFHGRTGSYDGLGYYGLEKTGEENVIIVYPGALPEEGPRRDWRDPGDRPRALRDYQFFDALVQEISENYCIDPDEIYAVGHSLGGWFTSMLSCARGSTLRGVGIVAGSPMIFPPCSGPSSAIIFHNPSDPLASFAGGEQIRNALLKQNQCGPETEPYPALGGMECVKYTHCLPGSAVVFCSYFGEHGAHMRPSGATAMMYRFWEEQ